MCTCSSITSDSSCASAPTNAMLVRTGSGEQRDQLGAERQVGTWLSGVMDRKNSTYSSEWNSVIYSALMCVGLNTCRHPQPTKRSQPPPCVCLGVCCAVIEYGAMAHGRVTPSDRRACLRAAENPTTTGGWQGGERDTGGWRKA
jgi:hypothetical protein